MKLIEKIKDIFPTLNNEISNYVKYYEAKNHLASMSSFDFVDAFTDVAKSMCYRRTTPYTETFCALCVEAETMLLKGQTQAEVLQYFDGEVEKMTDIKNAIGLIKACGLNINGSKELIKDIKKVENTIIEALEENVKLRAENEQLFSDNQKYLMVMLWGNKKDKKNLLKQIKAEAYKECIEKLKDTALEIKENAFQGCYVISKANFDNLLKELVGDSNGKEV